MPQSAPVTLDELATRLATNAIDAAKNAGDAPARLGDFNDVGYQAWGGGEAVEAAVVEQLKAAGMVVVDDDRSPGARIFGTSQEAIDKYLAGGA